MLERFGKHWAAPKMDRWIMRIVPNAEAMIGMMRSGELNFLAEFGGDPEVLEALAKDVPAIKITQETDIGFEFLGFNNRRPPFGDAGVPRRPFGRDRPRRSCPGGMERLCRARDLPCLAGAAVLVRGRRETAGERRPGGARDPEIGGLRGRRQGCTTRPAQGGAEARRLRRAATVAGP